MKESTRVLRFAIIGTLNAVITAVVIWVMMDLFHQEYKISNLTGYFIAQVNNFIWGKYWIYISEENKGKSLWAQIFKFTISCVVSYIAQFLFIYVLIDILDMNAYLAQFFGLFVYGAVNFLFNRFITFR
ncbi:GtrA family protein [Bacteroides coprosuis]|uniref:GtrA family protein n=2 Tax=Bacteroides TaxID=816 RepID=UPI001DE7F52C|nr:GtrA family protein [Bacteroides coprosuis]HJD92134.1 GtrA family protein [Bacteroides coprosuis]